MDSYELYKKAYAITKHLIGGNIKNIRYIGKVVIPGIYPTLVQNYGLGRSNKVINGMKDAIYDFIGEEVLGGIEPTFLNKETWDWWENLSDDYFVIVERTGNLELKEFIEGPIFEEA